MPDTFHSQQTGASAVHPSAFIQSTDPGAIGANKMWINTTTTASVWNRRNSTNTGWTVVGSAMTTLGDLEYAASGGGRTRLPAGAEGQTLTISSGVPAWGASSGAALYLARTMY
jgi:hypothetical protein